MVESFLKYLQFEKRLSAHTVTSYQTDLKQLCAFLSENFRLEDPGQADFGIIRTWVIHLVDSGMDPSSVNRKIACLRTFYKFLMAQGGIEKNPMTRIRVLKTRRRLPAFIKEQEMERILDKSDFADTFGDWRELLVMELFYATGIRLSELLTLEEKNIDYGNRTIRVLGKRNKERVIPFSPHLLGVLNGYCEMKKKTVDCTVPYLIVNDEGKQCYPGMIYRIVKNRLSAATSEKKSPHVLRHTYATHLLNNGAEINAVKDLLGHTSLAATQVYTHNSIDKIRKVFDQAHPKA